MSMYNYSLLNRSGENKFEWTASQLKHKRLVVTYSLLLTPCFKKRTASQLKHKSPIVTYSLLRALKKELQVS